jgi:hypothetical protein
MNERALRCCCLLFVSLSLIFGLFSSSFLIIYFSLSAVVGSSTKEHQRKNPTKIHTDESEKDTDPQYADINTTKVRQWSAPISNPGLTDVTQSDAAEWPRAKEVTWFLVTNPSETSEPYIAPLPARFPTGVRPVSTVGEKSIIILTGTVQTDRQYGTRYSFDDASTGTVG